MSANAPVQRLRFGGSTFSFMWSEPALKSLRTMMGLGLNDFDVILAPKHLWPDELNSGLRLELAATLRTDGIRIESLNLPALDCNLASCIAEVRSFSVALYESVFALAHDLGVRNVVVVPGRISGLLPPAQADSVNWLADSIGQLIRIAERLDQKIYLESHPLTPIPSAALMAGFLDRVGHPRLLVAYDVANAEFIGESQTDALRSLGPRLGQVHLSDGTRTSWRHDRIGSGSVGFTDILAALKEIGFKGINILEIISADPVSDMAASIKRLS